MEVLLKILPLLAVVILGYILYRIGFLKESILEGFKKIVVNVTLPAGLVVAFASIDFQVKYVIVFISVFIACTLMLMIGKALARLFKIKSPYFPYLLTGFEAGMIGYALYGGIYGLDRLSEFGIIDVGQVLFVFLVTVPMIAGMGKKDEHGFLKKSLTTAVKSPVIWSIVIGLILSISGIGTFADTKVYSAVKDIFDFISRPTPVLICLVIGSGLKFSFIRMKMESMTALLKIVLSVVFAIAIVFAVMNPLGLQIGIKTALFSMFVLPGPFIIPVFMDSSNRNEVEYVSNTLSIGTLLALVGFIIVSFI
ncbi:MAG: hypothetical protein R3232_00325 [Clostridia bacterium]|nr:hypothetical protein [Clostridia bacterium]